MISPELLKKSVDSAPVDLKKIGWSESNHDDEESLSYIKRYIFENYGVKIQEPLDWIILSMIYDFLEEQLDEIKKRNYD